MKLLFFQITKRRERTILVILSAAIIASAFTLFVSASSATTLTADQSLSQYWRTTYDILVRAPDSVSEIEEQYGMVRANHLSGTAGGITLEQWEAIKSIEGVGVAAPIAMLGYLPRSPVLVSIQDDLPMGIYEVTATVTISDGEQTLTYSRPPYYTRYDFDTTTLRFTDPEQADLVYTQTERIGITQVGQNASTGWWGFPVWTPSFNDKLLIAAIDPEQEAKLIHLDEMVTNGVYLQSGLPFLYPEHSDFPLIPALLNRHDYIQEEISIQISQVGELPPQGGKTWIEWLLAIPDQNALDTAARTLVWEDRFDMQREWIDSSAFIVVKGGEHTTRSKGVMPEIYGPLSAPSPVNYQVNTNPPIGLPGDMLVLEAIPVGTTSAQVAPETSAFLNRAELEQIDAAAWGRTPEITYRSLQPRLTAEVGFEPAVMGAFEIDPLKALGEDAINQVPLETYLPPTATLRYDESVQAIQPPVTLSPTLNKEGYLAAPPEMLIPLDQVPHIFENGCWQSSGEGLDGTFGKAKCEPVPEDLISAVRVRVGEIEELTPAAQARIERVAQEIVARTGLHVDIMVGSSPQPVLVHLPGRGYIEELWVKKGVATLLHSGLNRADQLLFAVMLLACLLFLFNANLISALGRLPEFGLLRALGWRRGAVFRLLLGEALLLGLAAGLLASLAALGLTRLFDLPGDPARTALLAPLGMSAFLLGALLPAAWAAWVSPTLAIQGGETAQSSRRGPGGSLPAYVAGGLLRRPARLLVTLLGMCLAAGLLALLRLVQDGQDGQLYATLLGAWIRTQVQPFHLLMGGVALLAAVLGVGQVMLMNVVERRKEIGLLNALGWRQGHVLNIFLQEGALIGLLGGGLGVLLAWLIYRSVYGPLPGTLPTWLGVVGAGLILPAGGAALAALYPAWRAARLLPLEALRGEERLERGNIVNGALSGLGLAGAFCLALIVGAFLLLTRQPPEPAPAVAVLPTPAPTPTLPPPAPWIEPTPVAVKDLPIYDVNLQPYPNTNRLDEMTTIRLKNQSAETLEDMALRIYPNYPVMGEEITPVQVDLSRINRQTTGVGLSLSDSLALLQANPAIEPGDALRVEIGTDLEIQPFAGLPEDVWVLRSPVPLLSMRETGAWREDLCSICVDIVFSQAARFQVALTLPGGWTVASNLVETGIIEVQKSATSGGFDAPAKAQKNPDLTHILSTGRLPVRDVAIVASPRLQVENRIFGDVEVKVYTLQGEARTDAMVAQVFSVAEEALALFSERFGSYPYPSLSLVLFPGGGAAGEEYPGLAFLYLKKDAPRLPFVVAHEIAHQWWYGAVGSDIYLEPWLDEGLAEFSALLYVEESAGPQAAQDLLNDYQNAVQVLALEQGKEWQVGAAVYDFPDFGAYETIVYRKGALFLDALRKEIGDAAFYAGLRQYYDWYKFGVGTGQGFMQAMQKASGQDLRPLFAEWVEVK